ncbi:MAG: hypothetical protein ACK45A_20060, partial [Planctomyces sp.]
MGLSICSIRQGLGQRGIDGDIRVAAGPPGDECGEEWWRTTAYRRLKSIQRRVGGAAERGSGWKARATIAGAEGLATATGDG